MGTRESLQSHALSFLLSLYTLLTLRILGVFLWKNQNPMFLKSTALIAGLLVSGYMLLRIGCGVIAGLKPRQLALDVLFLLLGLGLSLGAIVSLLFIKPF